MTTAASGLVGRAFGSPRRTLVTVLIAAAVVVAGWLAIGWAQTGMNALTFQRQSSQFQADLKDQDWDALTAQYPELEASAQALATSTRGLQWRLLSQAPLIGSSAKAVSALGRSAADLAKSGGLLLSDAKQLVSTRGRLPDGSIDLATIAALGPNLDLLTDSLIRAQAQLDGVPTTFLLPGLKSRFETAQQQAHDAGVLVHRAAVASIWLPKLLGVDGSRTWTVLLQNPAEARGAGGFPGAFVNIRSDNGRIRVVGSGTSEDIRKSPIPLDGVAADSQQLWGPSLAKWSMFNRSAHFPLTGSLTSAVMKTRGVPTSGVLAIDPSVVAAMLKVVGPITAAGETLTSENAEQFFTEDVYRRYPDGQQRDEVSMALVNAVMDALLTKSWNPIEMADALKGPLDAGHVRVWSAKVQEQAWLETTVLGGSVPVAAGPVVAVAENNSAPSKMDAFVKTRIDYEVGACPTGDVQRSTLTVSVRNDAPRGLPSKGGNYGRTDVPGSPEGSTSMVLYLYMPVGANLETSTLDGQAYGLYGGRERERGVWFLNLPINRGQERTLKVDFTEPTVQGVSPRVITQPMVNAPDVRVTTVPDCS